MDKHLKKRILGAVVTVVVIAIALPVVIDGSRQQLVSRDDVPPMPPMPDWAEVENQQRIRIDLEKLARGEATRELAAPAALAEADMGVSEVTPEVETMPAVSVAAASATPKPAPAAPAGANKSELPTVEKVAKPVASAPVATVPAVKPGAVDASGLPYSWSIQIGAFSQEANGTAMRDRLRKEGFKAFASTDPDGLTRVFVGPEIDQAEAERLRVKLQILLDRNDLLVRRFVPR